MSYMTMTKWSLAQIFMLCTIQTTVTLMHLEAKNG